LGRQTMGSGERDGRDAGRGGTENRAFEGQVAAMRRAGSVILGVCVALALARGAAWGEVSRAEIEAAIERMAKGIVSGQKAEGYWAYESGGVVDVEYRIGYTALMVLSLQHSGCKAPEVQQAIAKGLSFILQQEPEPKTYSAGLVQQVLYFDRAREHKKWVAGYAWMLCGGQKVSGPNAGLWSYQLPALPAGWAKTGPGEYTPFVSWAGDNSNGQFGILGLTYSEKAGYQIPREVWERATAYYLQAQHADGGWDYQSQKYRDAQKQPVAGNHDSTMSMTLAGTVSIYLCEEALADKKHRQCVVPPVNKSHEAGMKWIADHWDMQKSPYAWYAAERLGLLTGYSEFGGHDWYQEGVEALIRGVGGTHSANHAFILLFLSRGRNPIIINKLKREGDWNRHRYDISHLIEHISGPWQKPCQWRIVTLDSSVDMLKKVPILWISGHDALKFTDAEKTKLKEYVEKGGTILGEACCSSGAFDASFKSLVKELWPENSLNPLPKSHAIYTDFRDLPKKPAMMGMAMEGGQGRLGVLYLTNGISCNWEVGGARGKEWLAVGACIYLYVDKVGKRLEAEKAEASKTATTEGGEAAVTPGAKETTPEKTAEFGGAEH